MNIKQNIINQLNYGTLFTSDIYEKKKIKNANIITFASCTCLLFLLKKNIADHNNTLLILGSIYFSVLALNIILFRTVKNIRLFVTVFTIVQTVIVCQTLFFGTYKGASLLVVILGILVIMFTSRLITGSLLVLLILTLELIVFKYNSRVEWIYTYPMDIQSMFPQFFLTQIGIYFLVLYRILREKELNSQLTTEKENKKNMFIKAMHDVKTPLTVIKSNIELLQHKDIPESRKHDLRLNIDKMEQNILNILNAECLEKGRFILNKEDITNISDLTISICDSFRQFAQLKNIVIKSKIEKNVYVSIDPTHFAEVINNLIDNAIKYTQKNGVIVISLTSDTSKVYLKVTDTGIGINESDKARIFESYYQGENKSEPQNGLGIGLAIVKEICEAYKGSIDLSSSLIGEGSVFTVELPKYNNYNFNHQKKKIIIKTKAVYSHNSYNIPEYNESLKTILIVEDNDDILNIIISSFINKYNIIISKNGKDALLQCKNVKKIDLIITDLMMPVMNGEDFILALRKLENHKLTPLIIISAKTGVNIVRGLSMGAIDYIIKPFLIDELNIKTETILNFLESKEEEYKKKISNDLLNYISGGHYNTPKNTLINHSLLRELSITKKEQEIISGLANGLTYKEIAYDKKIALNTVRTHIYRIYKKCEVNNSKDLVKFLYNMN